MAPPASSRPGRRERVKDSSARFTDAVQATVAGLGVGEVVSYGDIAAQVGSPGAARAVGNVMAASEGLPWWRVVRADGSLATGKEREQARRLRAEGVAVVDGRVELSGPERSARGRE